MLVENQQPIGGDDCLTNLNWLVQPNNFPPIQQHQHQQPQANSANHSDIGDPKRSTKNYSSTFCDYKKEPVKPPFSYAQLITMAMEANGCHKVLLTDIYSWIRENFAYFKSNDTSWQNSVRHNLSLNKQFVKVPREAKDKGKGSYWMLDPRTYAKDPYCLRRRNFNEPQQRRSQRPEVTRPQVNPAVKNFLESTRRIQECRRHPFAGAGEILEDIGAQECVIADQDPMMFSDDYNRKLFKKDVESFDPAYQPNITTVKLELLYNANSSPTHFLNLNSPQNAGGDQQQQQHPKVRVEYNEWAEEFHPSYFAGARLPLEPEARQILDLQIPSPSNHQQEWWSTGLTSHPAVTTATSSVSTGGQSHATTTLLISPSGNNPLAKVFENLIASPSGGNNNICINNNNNNNIVINLVTTPCRETHPWLDKSLQDTNLLQDGDILDLDYTTAAAVKVENSWKQLKAEN